MKFQFTSNGKKSLDQLEKPLVKRILKKLKYWQDSNNPLQYSELIQSSKNLYKYRVGGYRIITSLSSDSRYIRIHKVEHRSKVYKHKSISGLG